MSAGSTFIRYEVWGEGIATATAMLRLGPRRSGRAIAIDTGPTSWPCCGCAPRVLFGYACPHASLMESLLSARLHPAEGCDFCGAGRSRRSRGIGLTVKSWPIASRMSRSATSTLGQIASAELFAIGVEPVPVPDDATTVVADGRPCAN